MGGDLENEFCRKKKLQITSNNNVEVPFIAFKIGLVYCAKRILTDSQLEPTNRCINYTIQSQGENHEETSRLL